MGNSSICEYNMNNDDDDEDEHAKIYMLDILRAVDLASLKCFSGPCSIYINHSFTLNSIVPFARLSQILFCLPFYLAFSQYPNRL